MPYIYIAYSREEPHLPIAVGDSAKEIAEQVGVSQSCVCSMVGKYERGDMKKSIYQRIYMEDEYE